MFKKSLIVVLACLAAKVHAVPIEEALANYSDKKYELAFEQFSDLADLGSPIAQLNVGVMYARGEFVEQNLATAYQFFYRAKLSGSPRVSTYIDLVSKKVSAADRAKAEKKAEEQLRKLQRETEPDTAFKASNAKHMSPAKLDRRVEPKFSRDVRKEETNFLDLTFMVDPYGITRHQTILSSTDKDMLKPVILAARETLYKPFTLNNKPVPVLGVFTRYMPSWGGPNEPNLEQVKKDLGLQKLNAESAGGEMQLTYARSLLAAHTLYEKQVLSEALVLDNPNDWFFLAAQNGSVAASYHLGQSLLTGRMCQVDPLKGLFWLERAVADGMADAYIYMGLELIYGHRVQQNVSRGTYLLRQVADAGYADAQLELAMLYSAHPDKTLHDLPKAEAYMKAVDEDRYTDQLTVFEARAMVEAALGDFDKAEKYQEKALKEADRYQLPSAHLKQNLDKIKNKQPIVRVY